MDFNIKDYLKKFENFLPPETRMRRAIADAIKNATGIDIDSKKISVRGKTAFLNVSNIIKSEILMKQGKIMKSVKENKYIQGIDKIN